MSNNSNNNNCHHTSQHDDNMNNSSSSSSSNNNNNNNNISLWSTVQSICNEIGGRAMQHSDGIICVLDCPRWSRRADVMLHLECPRASVCVESSIASLSGFMIIIQIQQPVVMNQRKSSSSSSSSPSFYTSFFSFIISIVIISAYFAVVMFCVACVVIVLATIALPSMAFNTSNAGNSSFTSQTTTQQNISKQTANYTSIDFDVIESGINLSYVAISSLWYKMWGALSLPIDSITCSGINNDNNNTCFNSSSW